MAGARGASAPSCPACVSAEEAFQQLGVDRTTGYRAIRDGTFPLPVIRVGRLIKVPTAALRRALGLDGEGIPSGHGYGGVAPRDPDRTSLAPQFTTQPSHGGLPEGSDPP